MTANDGWTAERIRAWLVSDLAAKWGVEPGTIDVRERFSRYGLDSLGATQLLTELAALLGRPLSPTLAWEFPTIESLAGHLSADSDGPARSQRRRPTRSVRDEPIAVVGIACRFPKAPNPDAYWRLLASGVDAITDVPGDRWDTDSFYDPDPHALGKSATRWGGFLEEINGFDPAFFGISPREAAQMDPQQRLMLELSWETLEDAGIPPRSLRDSRTGVFFGAMWHDYGRLSAGALERVTEHTATGQDLSIIPARVSYTLGLRGPSVALNTACSSSLVAIHYARQSLLLGESTLALAGGVNLLIALDGMVAMSRFGAMAPDGRSKAFDARANGYVRGEGGGVVALKPLSRALADGNPIYCVIRGSAINNDGFSNGLTAPSPKAQELVLRDAYANADVAPDEVQYVEAHGTGTMLGDPIEAGALGTVLGAGRPADRPLLLGSVKTNIGHLEAASGIAGFIKVALALKHREIPPSLHFEEPNPHIPFNTLRLKVVTAREPWPDDDGTAVAGVSAFGFGGTNCHVVLEGTRVDEVNVLPLASEDAESLRSLASHLREVCLDTARRVTVEELCAATAAHAGDHRVAMTARTRDDLAAQLDAFLQGRCLPGTATGVVRPGYRGPVFMFAGQGSQWARMGVDLLHEPAFRATLERCDRVMAPRLDGSLLEALLTGDAALQEDTAWVQPAIFAVQVSLAALWRSWGVEPAAVVGQSMGEVAAAHVAGCLSLDDAARVICVRSRIVGQAAGRGAMAVVELPMAEARRAISRHAERVSVAVSSGPTSTVISGEASAVDEVLARLERSGVYARKIKVDYASHCPQMDPLLPELLASLEGVHPRRATTAFYSTVAGRRLDGPELDASYWCANLREPVLFAETARLLMDEGHEVFVDVGPHPLLVRGVEQCLTHAGHIGLALASMRRGEPGRPVLLDSLGILHTFGQRVTWERLRPAAPATSDRPDETAETRPATRQEAPAVLLPLSAHTPAALAEYAGAMAAFLGGPIRFPLTDVCYTAGARRSHHESRLAVVGRSPEEIAGTLEMSASTAGGPSVVVGSASTEQPRVVFVFPGQGSQWLGMGRGLLDTEPVFRAAIEECDAAVRREAGFSVVDELRADDGDSQLDRIEVVQPTLFAVEVALAVLWRSWGIEPHAVVGHSMGEAAAAHVAGVLSLEDATRVICRRSALMAKLRGQGAMAVVELPLERARQALVGFEDRLSVAASNGPTTTVLTGEPTALQEVVTDLERAGLFSRLVKVDVASHSPQVDPLLDDLRRDLFGIAPRPAEITFCSTVTGEVAAGPELGPQYWARNLREPVMFASAIGCLSEGSDAVFVEMSPHPILVPSVEEVLRGHSRGGAAIGSLRRGQDARGTLLRAVAELYVRGCEVDWLRLCEPGGRVVPLPSYPFQRRRYWSAGTTLRAPEASSALDDVADLYDVELEAPAPALESMRERIPPPGAGRRLVVEGYLADRLAGTLGLDVASVPRDRCLNQLGMDSIMSMQLRNRVVGELQVELSVSDVLHAGGLGELTTLVLDLLERQETATDAAWTVEAMEAGAI